MTINDQEYLLPENSSVIINGTRRSNYTLSVAVANISLQPILHTVTLVVRAQSNPINMTPQNFTIPILVNQTLSVHNLTSSGRFPRSLPAMTSS